jgi:hypothetical protein
MHLTVTEKQEVADDYAKVHGTSARRARMMSYGLELLANKAAERKAEWEGEVEERKDAILAKIREQELAKELKESKRRKKQRQLKAMEDAAHADALQQVPLCTIEEKEELVQKAARIKLIFHILFSFASALMVIGFAMVLFAFIKPISIHAAQVKRMVAEVVMEGPNDNEPEGHFQDWMLTGSRDTDAVNFEYYLYHVANEPDVLNEENNDKPLLVQKGPYRFRRFHRKVNVLFEASCHKTFRGIEFDKDGDDIFEQCNNGDEGKFGFSVPKGKYDLVTYAIHYDYVWVGVPDDYPGDDQPKLNDQVTMVNTAYVRILSELGSYSPGGEPTTDRYLLAHFGGGIIKEQERNIKHRIKHMGLQRVLQTVPPIMLTSVYRQERFTAVFEGVRNLFYFHPTSGDPYYRFCNPVCFDQHYPNFAADWASNSAAITQSTDRELQLFRLGEEMSPAKCKLLWPDVNKNKLNAYPGTCISELFAQLLWDGVWELSLNYGMGVPGTAEGIDEGSAIGKNFGLRKWVSDSLLYVMYRYEGTDAASGKAEAIEAWYMEQIALLVPDLVLRNSEVKLVLLWAHRVYRQTFPYRWITRGYTGTRLSQWQALPCAAQPETWWTDEQDFCGSEDSPRNRYSNPCYRAYNPFAPNKRDPLHVSELATLVLETDGDGSGVSLTRFADGSQLWPNPSHTIVGAEQAAGVNHVFSTGGTAGEGSRSDGFNSTLTSQLGFQAWIDVGAGDGISAERMVQSITNRLRARRQHPVFSAAGQQRISDGLDTGVVVARAMEFDNSLITPDGEGNIAFNVKAAICLAQSARHLAGVAIAEYSKRLAFADTDHLQAEADTAVMEERAELELRLRMPITYDGVHFDGGAVIGDDNKGAYTARLKTLSFESGAVHRAYTDAAYWTPDVPLYDRMHITSGTVGVDVPAELRDMHARYAPLAADWELRQWLLMTARGDDVDGTEAAINVGETGSEGGSVGSVEGVHYAQVAPFELPDVPNCLDEDGLCTKLKKEEPAAAPTPTAMPTANPTTSVYGSPKGVAATDGEAFRKSLTRLTDAIAKEWMGAEWIPDNYVPPTASPTAPTHSPTSTPTVVPTAMPTAAPTDMPTAAPSNAGDTHVPTASPTAVPTAAPTAAPTYAPTVPTDAPTAAPTNAGDTHSPTDTPTPAPTASPTSGPTNAGDTHTPTGSPTALPTNVPTVPSAAPTKAPNAVGVGTNSPTQFPTPPTDSPTANPSAAPTTAPTASPTNAPSSIPTFMPTQQGNAWRHFHDEQSADMAEESKVALPYPWRLHLQDHALTNVAHYEDIAKEGAAKAKAGESVGTFAKWHTLEQNAAGGTKMDAESHGPYYGTQSRSEANGTCERTSCVDARAFAYT